MIFITLSVLLASVRSKTSATTELLPMGLNNDKSQVVSQQFHLRRGGLMVRVLDSRSSGPGSGPGSGHFVVFLGRHFTLTVPLSTQVYKWVPAKCWG